MSGPGEQRRKQKRQRDRVVAKALRNRDETREKLLEQGRELARRRAENVDRSRRRSGDASGATVSSAHSTLPSMDTSEEAAVRRSHSTVPARPKGSTVPAAVRLYGLGLYERIRPDGDEPSERSDPGPGSDPGRTPDREADAASVPSGSEDGDGTEGGERR